MTCVPCFPHDFDDESKDEDVDITRFKQLSMIDLQDLCDIQRQLISLLVFFDRVKPFIHSNRKPHDADAIDDLR